MRITYYAYVHNNTTCDSNDVSAGIHNVTRVIKKLSIINKYN